MAWEWSHTEQAIDDARENLNDLDQSDLCVIFAEWAAWNGHGGNFSERKYERALLKAKRLPSDVLVDFIWARMENLRLCDNGGGHAWTCPYGCHTVPFTRNNAEENDGDF